MPRMATELTQGQAFSRSSEEGGLQDTSTRAFRVVLLSPGEVFSPQAYCGVFVGDIHPVNSNLVCFSFDAKYDGDSRMVSIVTFNYRNFASASSSGSGGRQDPKTVPPEVRQANWSTTTSLMEIPASSWCEYLSGKWTVPTNPAGDRYEGVTKQVPVTTIHVDQMEQEDPLRHMDHVGKINDRTMNIGSHDFALHTVMLRGITSRAHVETFRESTFRGWVATYEFVYRANEVKVDDPHGGPGSTTYVLGWDRLQVVEGYNVINKVGALLDPAVDVMGLSLTHAGYKVQAPFTLAVGTEDKRVRAMVGIPSYDETGGWVQRPASSPVALNLDGTPRKVYGGNLKPLVVRYQVQDSIDMVARLNLRLQ